MLRSLCFFVNKPFTKRQMLYQHFSTVQHQINCKSVKEGEIPEKTDIAARKESQSKDVRKNQLDLPYRSRLFEKTINPHTHMRKSSFRSTLAIIPLEPVMSLADPRADPKVSFLDLIDLEEIEEIEENLKIKEILQQSKEEENPSQQTSYDAETAKKTETSEIQKPGTSRPSHLQVQDARTSTSIPDTETMKQSKKKLSNAETLQDTETPTEIYPENRSTTPLDNRCLGEDSQEIQIQLMQKQTKLSTFEEIIIAMFELPENIKELVPATYPHSRSNTRSTLHCHLKKSTFWITSQTLTV